MLLHKGSDAGKLLIVGLLVRLVATTDRTEQRNIPSSTQTTVEKLFEVWSFVFAVAMNNSDFIGFLRLILIISSPNIDTGRIKMKKLMGKFQIVECAERDL
ncbi:MAG: hypothetical protein EBR93_06105 [Bacteroidetes bacterium]|nr:hypothetical protein [Bacteroidota bacterium]